MRRRYRRSKRKRFTGAKRAMRKYRKNIRKSGVTGYELKKLDTAFNYTCIGNGVNQDTTGSNNRLATFTFQCANEVPQGTGFEQRVGRKYTIRSLQIKGFLRPGQSQQQNDMVKIIIVKDKQPNNITTPPNLVDIFASQDANSLTNLDNRMRFQILYSQCFSMGSEVGSESSSPSGFPINIYKKMSTPVICNGVGGSIQNTTTNNIWLIAIGLNTWTDGTSTTEEFPKFFGNMRIRFTDF